MDIITAYNRGRALMCAEIESRLQTNPEALSLEQAGSFPWGESLREMMGPCHDAEFAEAHYAAREVLREAQVGYDRQNGFTPRTHDQVAHIPVLSLPWAVEQGITFAQSEITAYIKAGGPSNKDWSWESPKQDGKYLGGSYERVSRTLDMPFDSGPCRIAAHDARNAELIRWAESDDPEAVELRAYAAALPLWAPIPADQYGNIGYDACVVAGEVIHGEYNDSVRVVLPIGFKWDRPSITRLMRLRSEADPPRFLRENQIFDIYELGVNTPTKYEISVGARIQSRNGKRHGAVAWISHPGGCFFIKWDDKRIVHEGDYGDWAWWWQVEAEVSA